MVILLIRYGELGLKSERVKRRFLRKMLKDIQASLMNGGVEHNLSEERGRIYVETDDADGAIRILSTIPGVFSFSPVMKASSDWEPLMAALRSYGGTRLKEGMTYGLKVRRVGKEGYSSQDVAVHGGSAVASHLPEGSVKVDLGDPDILFEVEIRGSSAYIFTDRVNGMGGLPRSSQGMVVLYLPPVDPIDEEVLLRVQVSALMMARRGCSLTLAADEGHASSWKSALVGSQCPVRSLTGPDIASSLIGLIREVDASGAVHPVHLSSAGNAPILHDRGEPIASFFPTAVLDIRSLREWKERLEGIKSADANL